MNEMRSILWVGSICVVGSLEGVVLYWIFGWPNTGLGGHLVLTVALVGWPIIAWLWMRAALQERVNCENALGLVKELTAMIMEREGEE